MKNARDKGKILQKSEKLSGRETMRTSNVRIQSARNGHRKLAHEIASTEHYSTERRRAEMEAMMKPRRVL